MKFPCDFHIKIIGLNKESFVMEVLSIIRNHYPHTEETAIRSQVSQQGNYLAFTITLYVQDQITLDSLYMELTKHPDIKMVL
jgi:putative lipoic acid-binding regulatory protein